MKKLSQSPFLLIIISVFLCSCNAKDRLDIERSAAAFDIKQGEASIKQSNQLFMKSFQSGDSTEVSNCFTTEAKLMIADMPTADQ